MATISHGEVEAPSEEGSSCRGSKINAVNHTQNVSMSFNKNKIMLCTYAQPF